MGQVRKKIFIFELNDEKEPEIFQTIFIDDVNIGSILSFIKIDKGHKGLALLRIDRMAGVTAKNDNIKIEFLGNNLNIK